MAVKRAGAVRISDDMPARTPHRAEVRNQGYFAKLSPALIVSADCVHSPTNPGAASASMHAWFFRTTCAPDQFRMLRIDRSRCEMASMSRREAMTALSGMTMLWSGCGNTGDNRMNLTHDVHSY